MELFLKHAKKQKKELGDDFKASKGAHAIANLSNVLQLEAYAPIAFCQYFLKFNSKVLTQIDEFAEHLKLLCNNEDDAEKTQKTMLGVIEQTVYDHKKKLLTYTPHILKALYENDIVEDKVILAWSEKPTKKWVKKSFVEKMIESSQAVLDWLKDDSSDEESSSEEESSEEESEEEKVEDKPLMEQQDQKMKEEVETLAKKAAAIEVHDPFAEEEDEESDIDIDNI